MRVKMHPKGNKESIVEVDENQCSFLKKKGFVNLEAKEKPIKTKTEGK